MTLNNLDIKKPDGDYLPLHSLMGNLHKHYKKNQLVESDFTLQALKISINLLDKFNDIRNNKSFAHANEILNYNESKLVVEFVSSLLNFLNTIEPQKTKWSW